MNKDQKKLYCVLWEDHINIGIIEVSSSREKAIAVKTIANGIWFPEKCVVVAFDDFIADIKAINRERLKKNGDDVPFCCNVKDYKKIKIDFLYNKFVSLIEKTSEEKDHIYDALVMQDIVKV